MKRKTILFCILLASLNSFGQAWDYPIKPGTLEWKALENNAAKVAACQLSSELLKNTTTEQLLEICLKYPLLNDIYAFNDLNKGGDKLINDFNGIRELYKRVDLNDNLLNFYRKKLEKKAILNLDTTNISKGEYIVSISTLEILLCRHELQNQISKDKQKEILKNLLNGYEIKKTLPEYFQGVGFKTNYYSRLRTMLILDASKLMKIDQKIIESSLSNGNINDANTIDKIDYLSYDYLK